MTVNGYTICLCQYISSNWRGRTYTLLPTFIYMKEMQARWALLHQKMLNNICEARYSSHFIYDLICNCMFTFPYISNISGHPYANLVKFIENKLGSTILVGIVDNFDKCVAFFGNICSRPFCWCRESFKLQVPQAFRV